MGNFLYVERAQAFVDYDTRLATVAFEPTDLNCSMSVHHKTVFDLTGEHNVTTMSLCPIILPVCVCACICGFVFC